jgi:hypothetical protein
MKEISKKVPTWSDGRPMTQEEYEKLLNARDSILAFMLSKDFTVEEVQMVLAMCEKELDAATKRTSFKDIRKDEDDGQGV